MICLPFVVRCRISLATQSKADLFATDHWQRAAGKRAAHISKGRLFKDGRPSRLIELVQVATVFIIAVSGEPLECELHLGVVCRFEFEQLAFELELPFARSAH